MPVQMRTVEFQVPGLVDGTTPAPALSFDPRSKLYKAPDPDGIVRFSAADMITLTGGNLGLFDPDFGVGGSFSDRFTQLLEVVTAGGAAIASIQVVDAEGQVEQQEIVLGPEGNFYEKDLILVPQGSELRFFGYTATPAQPVVIRISVVVFTSVEDYAELRQIACCSGGGVIPPGGDTGPTYVYRPGGVAGENVYTDFPSLTAALALRAGPKWVEVDDSFVAIPTIPAGIWDVNQAIFQGLPGADETVLRGLPGARLTNLSRIQGTLSLQNADPAAAMINLASAEVFDVADGASLVSIAGQPVIDVPGAGTAILRLYASAINNVALLGPPLGVSGGAGSGLLIQLWEGSSVGNDAITSAVGSIVTAQMRSSAASFNRDQTPLLGGLVFNYFVPDQQTPVNVGAGGTLPILGFASVTGDPVTLPLAISTQGPIYVQNRLTTMLTINAGVGNSIDAAASILIPPGAVVTFKSNGLLAWLSEDKSFVEFDAAGMPIPGAPDIVDLGDVDNQWRAMHNRLDVRVAPTAVPGFGQPPTLNYDPTNVGELCVVTVGYGGGGLAEVDSANDVWAFIKGRIGNFDADPSVSRLRNASTSGFVHGGTYMYSGAGAGNIAEMDLQSGVGSMLGGYAVVAYQTGSAIIRHVGARAARTVAYASVSAASPAGAACIVENGGMNDVFVAAYGESRVYARDGSSVFRGALVGNVAGQYALMENLQDAFACLIHARVQAVAGFNARARVEDEAGWVSGRTNGGLMETQVGVAAWVRGFAEAGAAIYAAGHASTAWGRAAAGQIIGVAANNADQWGVGVNTLADSTRFGVGWRFKKTELAPAAPANGDCWIAGGSMYVHTNGVTKNLDNIV